MGDQLICTNCRKIKYVDHYNCGFEPLTIGGKPMLDNDGHVYMVSFSYKNDRTIIICDDCRSLYFGIYEDPLDE